jgi:hypothetical protein
MDYQASTIISKISVYIASLKKAVCIVFISATSLGYSFAQTTTNPLTVDVSITASVLVGTGIRPETPPIVPGPVNMVDTIDAAIFKGLSYPGSTISILKNGIVIAELPASPDGSFEIHVRSLAAGTYTFGVRAKDKSGLTSKLLSFTVYISGGIVTIIDGILIPPTVTSDYIEVKKRESITFFGSSVPNAEVRLSFMSSVELLKSVITNASGTWKYTLDTSLLSYGDYEVKARSITMNTLSLYSDSLTFRIGDVTRARPKASSLVGFRKKCDLNDDGRVNLLDFSIMAFWYKRLGFPQKVDLNTDSKVNLTDLSILAYCWTG